ncbi:MAG: thiolase domain-containing protein [Nitrososphaerota archaeon]|nr:thiolase domain-containing protein [Candidatus Bathyarchaeota archaeon]MDW8062118.1 thiolase domain-containing protein [Nitrososphaerota archaeon]
MEFPLYKKRDVAIVGVGTSKFGERWDKSLRELAWEAAVPAVEDAGIQGRDVQLVIFGNMSGGLFVGQEHVGALIADFLGLNPTPAIRVEAACASGGVALFQGYLAVASGLYDVVAVGGIEKMTDVPSDRATLALAGAMDSEWEAYFGATFPGLYALIAQRYMYEYKLSRETLAEVAVKNHYHGSMNPFAHFQFRTSVERVVSSPLVADPLRRDDCCPISDGAACVILVPAEKARRYTDTPIYIKACTVASDKLALFEREDITTLRATIEASRDAYRIAKLSPADIDVVEVHDCFTIAEIIALEDLGFATKGEAGKLYEEGETYVGGKLPVNTDGGLKAGGHAVGATGVKQVVELVKQLRGEAEKGRQVSNAEYGLAQNVGGSGATVVVTIVGR